MYTSTYPITRPTPISSKRTTPPRNHSHPLHIKPVRGFWRRKAVLYGGLPAEMDDVDADRERKILIAVDDGEESMYALTWAIKNVISQNSKDTLVLLYAKQPPVVFTSLGGTGYLFSSDIVGLDKYRDDVAENVIERARRLCRDLNNVKVEVRVETGDPRDVICEAAEKVGADVLVMGTRGYGLIKRALVGSVSNHCSQKAKCPVLVVKKPKSV